MGERWYLQQRAARKKHGYQYAEKFGDTVATLRASGFIPIPLNGKKPLRKGWSKFWMHPPSDKAYEAWRTKNANANVGLCLGEIVALDIDLDEQSDAESAQELVFTTLGPTSFIRVGRPPRRTCFYRLGFSDAQCVSNWKVGSVEMLAAGKQSVIFGIHPDTHKPFLWPEQSILAAQKQDIPLTSPAQLEALRSLLRNVTEGDEVAEGEERACTTSVISSSDNPIVGERNNYLFREACDLGHDAVSEEDLLTKLQFLNSSFSIPLDRGEVKQIATSVWRYKQGGTLWKKGKDAPIVVPVTREVAGDVFKRLHPIACKLYLTLLETRHTKKEFTIPQKRTGEEINCSTDTISKALKELKHYGLIIDEGRHKGGSRKWRAAKLYKFGSGGKPPTV